MLCLLTQPKKELQTGLRTNNTQNHQKIELYGNQITKDLKKPLSSRWIGGAEMQKGQRATEMQCGTEGWRLNGQSYIHVWWIKMGRDTLGASDASPGPDHTAHGSRPGR